MPEYLTPAVYVEETSFRSKSIEGVPTSTFGMAGRTQYGPVPYKIDDPNVIKRGTPVIMTPKPVLVTSYTEYERLYGDLATSLDEPIYLAHAARSFFENGGRRLYVSRAFAFAMTQAGDAIDVAKNFAKLDVGDGSRAVWRARWPGVAGQQISMKVKFVRSKNIVVGTDLKGVLPGAAVELGTGPKPPPDDTAPNKNNIRIVDKMANGKLGFRKVGGGVEPVADNTNAFHITLTVTARFGEDRVDDYSGLELEEPHSVSIGNVLQAEDPSDEAAVVWLDRKKAASPTDSQELLDALIAQKDFAFLTGGDPDTDLDVKALRGDISDADDATKAATGLEALGEIDDIAIVACPDTADLGETEQPEAVRNLLSHCERLKYRIAIVDPPKDSSISEVRDFRSKFDSKYGALYYPWIRVLDPTAKNDPGAPPKMLDLPPSGFTAGIYARSDIERGVHKAPANEVVRGMTELVYNVTYDRQAVLNPEGINALRFFKGRSNRVWGARTMSSDPEWKYVNVRRLFIYLEHSIEKATQWAVFEPNNERLWASIRQTIEDFLLVTWRTGALMGTKPEEAYFVRCDRTTMTQNDLDNGRLICLIGVAPTYPAEFVIFRIGQWTADAKQS